jgi:membrane protease YdiL (CAAX protease family)
MILESITTLFFLGVLGWALNTAAWNKKFYTYTPFPSIPLTFQHVVTVFAIYLGAIFFLPSYLFILTSRLSTLTLTTAFILQLICTFTLLIALMVYCTTCAPDLFKKVWKNGSSSTSYFYDFGLGVVTLLLAFPIVAFVNQFFDLLLYLIYQLESYEQVAVRFLKTSLQSPSLKILALFSIVILAPLIEEFLFRGTLQSYLKGKMGSKAAILLSATTFACFHFSAEQGLGNLSLIPSLFTFGCFLGFIYEKQGSLLASIGLHSAFNLVNSVRILFSEGLS